MKSQQGFMGPDFANLAGAYMVRILLLLLFLAFAAGAVITVGAQFLCKRIHIHMEWRAPAQQPKGGGME